MSIVELGRLRHMYRMRTKRIKHQPWRKDSDGLAVWVCYGNRLGGDSEKYYNIL